MKMNDVFKEIFEKSNCFDCEWFLELNREQEDYYHFNVCKRLRKVLRKYPNGDCYLYKKNSPKK